MCIFDLTGTEKNIKKILFFSLIYFSGVWSCTLKKSAEPKDDPASARQIGLVAHDKSAPVVVPFPHPQNFKNIEEHGVFAITYGQQTCANCHGAEGDETGGTSKVSCKSCHPAYPHEEGMLGKHSDLWRADNQNSCKNCHESQVNASIPAQTGLPQKCTTCHPSWPHPVGWLNDSSLEFHGTASLRSGNKTCLKCHENTLDDNDLAGAGHAKTEDKGKCASCHVNYPHQSDFAKGHGEFLFNSGDNPEETIATCLNCHKEDFGSGSEVRTQVPTCKSCHTMYPHPKNFAAPGTQNFHGDMAKGAQSTSCLMCHKKDESPTLVPRDEGSGQNNRQHSRITSNAPTCAACHSNYPHAESWLKTGQHGAAWLKDKTPCLQCHTSSAENGVEGFCLNCHNYPHPKNFILKSHHPMFEFSHTLNEGQCLLCHNESKEKAIGIPTCDTCHEKSAQD